MSARNAPIEHVGAVAIYAPVGPKPYFRLRWIEVDGSTDSTSAGKILDGARWKAQEIAERLERAASPFAMASLLQLIEDFIAAGRSSYSGELWKRGYKKQTQNQLMRSVKGHENHRAMDIDRELLDSMRAQAGTDRMVRQNTTALRGLLRWGYRHPERYFTPSQAELLPPACVNPIPTKATVQTMPKRKTRTRAVGQHDDFIQESDAPNAEQVSDLATCLACYFPTWGALAVELAANLGFRWGEQFQLTVPDVHLDGCPILKDLPHVHVDYQIDAGATAGDGTRPARLSPPKGYKTRIVGVPELSFTGFPLLEVLTARVAAVAAEHAAGKTRDALLHPAKGGGLMWQQRIQR